MAYILKKIGHTTNVMFKTFECDDEADLATVDISNATMGSRCYVINSGKWYALNSHGEWKPMPSGTVTPDSPDGPSDSKDVIYDGGEEA